MTVGFWASGVCAKTLGDAVSLFSSQFPKVSGNYLYSITNATPLGVDGATLQVLAYRLDKSEAPFSLTHQVFFPACDTLTAPVTLSDIFAMPASPDVSTAWLLGFATPLICYLASWGYGVVVNMFRGH